MIRVIHIIWNGQFGGIERLVADLAKLQKATHRLDIDVLMGQVDGQMLELFEKAGCAVVDGRLASGFDIRPEKIWALRRTLRNYDVIHLHTFNLPLALAIFATGKPVLFTQHGNFGIGRKRTWKDAAKELMFRSFVKEYVNSITFNSEYTKARWAEKMGMVATPSRVIPNGIAIKGEFCDQEAVAPDIAAWAGDSFVVGTTARFKGCKRIDRLIRAFAKFCPQRNVKLLLVGEGELRRELELLVDELGIRKMVSFTGFRSDVPACLAGMDVFVIPSQSEAFGLVAVEALALGKPTVVFSDGGGLTEIVRPLCAADVVIDIDRLTDRLAYYYIRRDQIPILRSRCVNRAMEFDIQRTSSEFETVYRHLADLPINGPTRC